jgi:hypothetical protein
MAWIVLGILLQLKWGDFLLDLVDTTVPPVDGGQRL